ncbi:MAG: hypothetical protein H6737_00720 [Alphaproteobacteria bacterium]|nr:hypothetical protein [Alphaproteobacteria bacterium]
MKFAHLALVAGALGLTMACTNGTDTQVTDTFDTGEAPPTVVPDPLIQLINPAGCNGAGTAYEFAIENSGWASDAVLYIFDTSFDPTFDEEHPMSYVDSGEDANGFWDQWSTSLADEASLASQVPGTSTVFNCDNEGFLTYVIEVYNEGGAVSDCAVFGDDPQAIISGTWPGGAANPNGTVIGNKFADCINWNQ